MDKKLISCLKFTLAAILPFASAIFLLLLIYRSFTLVQYNLILLILITVSIIITVIMVLAAFAVFLAVEKRRISPGFLIPARLGMKLALPVAAFVAGVFKGDRDAMRSLFIDLNNMLVQSGNPSYEADSVLLLLPHCLQNSECTRKITGDIHNCIQCGRCSIGPIVKLAIERNVDAEVVTGGTAARNMIGIKKPGIVLSVACERDLASGISDIGSIPVIGILNSRPNGPCFNTSVDVDLIAEKLDALLGARKEGINVN